MTVTVARTSENAVTLEWDDGEEQTFSARWLRDNVPTGRHRHEGQRTFDINEIDDPHIVAADLDGDAVRIDFSDTSDRFSVEWLRSATEGGVAGGRVLPPRVYWDATAQDALEFANYEEVVADRARRLDWLHGLRDRGFGLLRNTPPTEATVTTIVELFGHVSETNYGRLFDVIVRPDPANLANTSVRIGMHTDNPYRDPVPGLQLLHCIVNESDGGESQLCDGHRIAEELRRDDPDAFELLTTYPVKFRYLEDGVADIQSYRPLIEIGALGEVRTVRYNSRSASAFRMPADVMDAYYVAYRSFAQRLSDPAGHIQFRLGPGDCMVFDNERVLHGRSAYTVGHRHLQGCYANKDMLQSTIRVLEAQVLEAG